MKLYKHTKSGRIMSHEEWLQDEEMIRKAGGEIYSISTRLELGILEPYKMPNGLPYPGFKGHTSYYFNSTVKEK